MSKWWRTTAAAMLIGGAALGTANGSAHASAEEWLLNGSIDCDGTVRLQLSPFAAAGNYTELIFDATYLTDGTLDADGVPTQYPIAIDGMEVSATPTAAVQARTDVVDGVAWGVTDQYPFLEDSRPFRVTLAITLLVHRLAPDDVTMYVEADAVTKSVTLAYAPSCSQVIPPTPAGPRGVPGPGSPQIPVVVFPDEPQPTESPVVEPPATPTDESAPSVNVPEGAPSAAAVPVTTTPSVPGTTVATPVAISNVPTDLGPVIAFESPVTPHPSAAHLPSTGGGANNLLLVASAGALLLGTALLGATRRHR